jgi:UDP-N-acetylmuramoylalanine--D-glutamate ligase
MKALKGQQVLVLGLGESGQAMVRWCLRHGALVRAWDSRQDSPHLTALKSQHPQVDIRSDALSEPFLNGVQRIFKSPGLAPNDGRIAPAMQWAAQHRVPVQGELSLFSEALSDLKEEIQYSPKVLAITGTNGKTTTTSMTRHLIDRVGLRVVEAGNIGPTMLDTLSQGLDLEGAVKPHPASAKQALELQVVERLPLDTPQAQDETSRSASFQHLPEVWVLELSSFQLHEIQGFDPSAAVVLNISEDHLDWHGTINAYAQDKARIYGDSAVMVVNQDEPLVTAMIPASKPGVGRFAKPVHRQVVRFGLSAPTRPGDFGLVTENAVAWLVRALPNEEPVSRSRSAPLDEPVHLQRLLPVDAMRVRGRHNASNAMAALALATAIGCPLGPILYGLRDYGGEPHRVEYVATVQGIEAFDDSKGTNVGATLAAVNGLSQERPHSKLVLILGGEGKGQNFTPLIEPLRRCARAVALIGREAPGLSQLLEKTGLTLACHDTLQAATRWAFSQAQTGDAVLLSPACASLDMFTNYVHRAEVFVDEVRALLLETGEVSA